MLGHSGATLTSNIYILRTFIKRYSDSGECRLRVFDFNYLYHTTELNFELLVAVTHGYIVGACFGAAEFFMAQQAPVSNSSQEGYPCPMEMSVVDVLTPPFKLQNCDGNDGVLPRSLLQTIFSLTTVKNGA